MQQETRSHEQDIASAESKVRRLADALAEAKAELRELRGAVAKTRNAPRECTCGCGGVTSGGLFLPGHDAKMRSRLLAEIRDGASEESERAALATLRQFPNLLHGVGDWDLGRDRKARADKEVRAAQAKADRDKAHATREADKKAREALTARSRKETNDASKNAADRKREQIADAQKAGKITVPASK